MDARPSRPTRSITVAPSNENLPPADQGAHQRNKSAGNILAQDSSAITSSGMMNGAMQTAAKRAVFADRSNTSKNVPLHQNATTVANKTAQVMAVSNMVSAVSNAKENDACGRVGLKDAKDANSRPANRHMSKGSQSSLPTTNVGYIFPVQAGTTANPNVVVATVTGAPPKRGTFIYQDGRPLSSSNANFNANANGVTLAGDVQGLAFAASDGRQPRHYQSQPALKATTTFTTKSEPANKYLSTHGQVDDDLTEVTYLDAVEEHSVEKPKILSFTLNQPFPVNAIQLRSDADTIQEKNQPTVESRAEDFPLYSADQVVDASDEDDDYFDDQGYTTAHSFRSRGDSTVGGGATTVMIPPNLTKKGMAEVYQAKIVVAAEKEAQDDDEDEWDISMVSEYNEEIFEYYKELEIKLMPNAHYMDAQTEIVWSMRGVLIDWVIQVHTRFGLLPETLFLTVNFIDRFLSCKIVSLGKLQLVGATALFVAAKYEEINCPSVNEIVYMVDGGFSAEEILKAERFMLTMLNFELGWPGPMSFLRRISKADDYDLETRTLAKYFLEVTIMDERFVATPSSYAAAGAHCLSRMVLDKGAWTPAHVYYSGYTLTQLKPLVSTLLDCCRIARRHHLAVFDKYSDRRFKRAALYVETELQRGFTLSFQRSTPMAITFEGAGLPGPGETYADVQPALKMPIPLEG